MNDTVVEVVDRIKYLGVTIVSDPSFSFSAENDIGSFNRSANSILNVLNGPDKTIQMHLLHSNCVPTLTYACAVKEFSSKEMSDCNVALNKAIRRIFTFHRWESVRFLRESFGYKSIYEIFEIAKRKFLASLESHQNALIARLYAMDVI